MKRMTENQNQRKKDQRKHGEVEQTYFKREKSHNLFTFLKWISDINHKHNG